MAQNTSSAVMQQRAEAHDSLDFFPTPPWATRALMQHVLYLEDSPLTVWEPACGAGDMARPLAEFFKRVIATDIHRHGDYQQHDFLQPYMPPIESVADVAWVITNPPFRLAEQFIERARQIPTWEGTAMLVRSAFLEGGDRYRSVFSKNPPSVVAQFSERVIMHKGVLRDPSKLYFDEQAGKMKRPSTATAYCWLVWERRRDPSDPTAFEWIPPCRKRLERVGDYPTTTTAEAA